MNCFILILTRTIFVIQPQISTTCIQNRLPNKLILGSMCYLCSSEFRMKVTPTGGCVYFDGIIVLAILMTGHIVLTYPKIVNASIKWAL